MCGRHCCQNDLWQLPSLPSLKAVLGYADVCVGDAVAEMTFGGFADYAVLPARQALPIPHPGPEMVALLTSGLTASIGRLVWV